MAIQKIIAKSVNEGFRLAKEEFGVDAMIIKTVKRNNKVELFVDAPEASNRVERGNSERDLAAAEKQALYGKDSMQTEYQAAKLKMLSAYGDLPETQPEEKIQSSLLDKPPIKAMRAPKSKRSNTSFDAILGNIKGAGQGGEQTVDNTLTRMELDAAVVASVRGNSRIDNLAQALSKQIVEYTEPVKGIKAFVGPAGSGKTTTLIKLITRHVLQYGPETCAIINCDRYRSGAREQLVRMGELLDVQVLNTNTSLSLNEAIAKVAHRDLIVIDMPGLGMTDPLLGSELYKLATSNYEIERYLVLPGNLQGAVMLRALEKYAKRGRSPCIFTHLDECSSFGAIINFLIHTQQPLAFTSAGCHIPEDLTKARCLDFVHDALALAEPDSDTALDRLSTGFAKVAKTDFTNGSSNRKVNHKMVMDV